MKRYSAYDYRVSVNYYSVDNMYVATVMEFPFLSCHSATHGLAVYDMRGLLVDVLDDMYDTGKTVPIPIGG